MHCLILYLVLQRTIILKYQKGARRAIMHEKVFLLGMGRGGWGRHVQRCFHSLLKIPFFFFGLRSKGGCGLISPRQHPTPQPNPHPQPKLQPCFFTDGSPQDEIMGNGKCPVISWTLLVSRVHSRCFETPQLMLTQGLSKR